MKKFIVLLLLIGGLFKVCFGQGQLSEYPRVIAKPFTFSQVFPIGNKDFLLNAFVKIKSGSDTVLYYIDYYGTYTVVKPKASAGGGSIDSTFSRLNGSYVGRTVTTPVYRSGPISIGRTDTTGQVNFGQTGATLKAGLYSRFGDASGGYNVMKLRPLAQPGLLLPNEFNIWATNFQNVNLPYDTASNFVYRWGDNVGGGGGRLNPLNCSNEIAMEQRFYNTLLNSKRYRTIESHWQTQDTLGAVHRVITWAAAHNGETGGIGFASDGVYFSDFNNGNSLWLNANRFQNFLQLNDSMPIYWRYPGVGANGLWCRSSENDRYVSMIHLDESENIVLGGQGTPRSVLVPGGLIEIEGDGVISNPTGANISIGSLTSNDNAVFSVGSIYLRNLVQTSRYYQFQPGADNLRINTPVGNSAFAIYDDCPTIQLSGNRCFIGSPFSGGSGRLAIVQSSDGGEGGLSFANTAGEQFYIQNDATGDLSFMNSAYALKAQIGETDGVWSTGLAIGGSSPFTPSFTASINGSLGVSGLSVHPPNVIATTGTITLSATNTENVSTPGSTQAAMTINLPASPTNGQYANITFANTITALTYAGNGNTIVGTAPTSGAIGQRHLWYFVASVGWFYQG